MARSFASSVTSSPVGSKRRYRPAVEERVLFSQVLKQTPSATEPNKISVVERFVTEIDAVPERFRDVEVLFLSHNSISSFSGFTQVSLPCRSLCLFCCRMRGLSPCFPRCRS